MTRTPIVPVPADLLMRLAEHATQVPALEGVEAEPCTEYDDVSAAYVLLREHALSFFKEYAGSVVPDLHRAAYVALAKNAGAGER